MFLFLLATIAMVSCKPEKLKSSQGFEYIVHKSTGGAKPNAGDYVYFHAYLRNGDSVIMTSRTQPEMPFFQLPATEDPSRKPSPVEDVLKLLSIGDSVTILFPLDTFKTKPMGFENADMLYYDVVLLDVKTDAQFKEIEAEKRKEQMAQAEIVMARMPEVEAMVKDNVAKYNSGALAKDLKTTASGLKYIIHQEGAGMNPAAGQTVTVHYYGALKDGKMFDSSFGRGEPIQFPLGVGQVIAGWDEGLALLKEGSKATFFIPYELAYGEAGSPPVIPAKAELIFYVELDKIQ